MIKIFEKYKYIEKYNTNVVEWHEALEHIDFLEKDDGIKRKYLRLLKSHGFISYHAHTLEKVKPVLKILESLKNEEYPVITAHLYGGITQSSICTKKHQDPCHVWYWQCQGKCKWIVNDLISENTFILSEGDVLYLPPKTVHEVIPLGPRLGISFGAEKP